MKRRLHKNVSSTSTSTSKRERENFFGMEEENGTIK